MILVRDKRLGWEKVLKRCRGRETGKGTSFLEKFELTSFCLNKIWKGHSKLFYYYSSSISNGEDICFLRKIIFLRNSTAENEIIEGKKLTIASQVCSGINVPCISAFGTNSYINLFSWSIYAISYSIYIHIIFAMYLDIEFI